MPVALAAAGPVATLRFTGPSPHRLDDACLDALEAVLDELERNPPAALLVLGTPGDFLAGADLKELLDCMETNAPRRALDKARRGRAVLGRLQRLPGFVACFIDGHCLGGGLDLALHCDARWISPRARLGHPGISRHFFTGWGGTDLLARFPGGRAMLLTGEIVGAEAALARGIADGQFADEAAARARAVELAAEAGAVPPAARALRKQAWLRSRGRDGRAVRMLAARLVELSRLA